jgi:hypothetical protein
MEKTSFELLIENEDMEENHYFHTINDVVELMCQHGQLKVLMDITTKMNEVKGW